MNRKKVEPSRKELRT